MIVCVAAAAWPVERLAGFDAWQAKLGAWVGEAAARGARLLVLPEYGALELAGALAGVAEDDAAAQIAAVAAVAPRIDAAHAVLARETNTHILAGTILLPRGDGRYVNRARLFTPDGTVGIQDKLVPTRFEREVAGVAGGGGPARVFETALGRIGICICYDAEFPLVARAMAEAGAEILLVPSCTDALAGYSRVRVGAMARALENQCYAVHAPTVGAAPWSPLLDVNVGAAAVYAPPDIGFPPTGIVAEAALDAPGWLYADLDLDRVHAVRRDGQVLNLAHWPEQAAPLAAGAELVSLAAGAGRARRAHGL
ncbi:MAG: carbon-nitrogen hydrolase family protein [Alphaproteobacteria bacterium]